MKYLCLVYMDAEHWSACSDQVCMDGVRELQASQHPTGQVRQHRGAAAKGAGRRLTVNPPNRARARI